MVGVAVQIESAVLIGTESVAAWTLVGVGVAIVIVLALLAWSGMADVDTLATGGRIRGMNEDEYRKWIAELDQRTTNLATALTAIQRRLDDIG